MAVHPFESGCRDDADPKQLAEPAASSREPASGRRYKAQELLGKLFRRLHDHVAPRPPRACCRRKYMGLTNALGRRLKAADINQFGLAPQWPGLAQRNGRQ